MEKQLNYKIKLGIFVFVGLILLSAGIFFIGQTKKLFSRTYSVSALFKDVNGLQVGNNVRYAGITVGAIDGIEIISDSTVRVDMILDVSTQAFIKKDAKATIGSDGLMGNKIMNISSGTYKYKQIEDKDTIGTTLPINMDEIIFKLKGTVDNVSVITGDLAAIVGNIHSGRGTIGKLFMDTVFADNLDKTIVNVKQGSKGFKQNMDAAQHSFLLKGFFKDGKKEPERK